MNCSVMVLADLGKLHDVPTALDRIQTLLRPEDYAKVKTLAKANRRTLSAMAAELKGKALVLDDVQEQLSNAHIKYEAKPDPRGTQPIPQYKAATEGHKKQSKQDKVDALLELMRTYLTDDD